jgi:integrase
MTQEAMGTLLRQPDVSTKMGVRDMFFMVLMYDTAARDCEMLSMRFCDIDPEKKTVYLFGKGSKPRLVPISENTALHFRRYESLFHPSGDGSLPMFYTIRRHERTQMSDDNVARFIKKYAAKAKVQCPEIPERIYPHMFRRSRAMHLYRSGMPLALLAEWLGHEDPKTSLIYAYADTEMKRKAIEQAEANVSIRPATEAGMWDGDEDMIKRLCGLA